ncbi:MAG TPA: VWA domain-containing protein [Candidatus Limnocylindrales bacterium]|nr:VWA domain-containing protein [Candidatus Limnocylindrales bacterium]
MGFELTEPLAAVLGLAVIAALVATWWWMRPPLPPRRARLSLGLRVLIVILLVAALAGLQVQTTPAAQSLVVAADLSASVQGALDTEAAGVRQILAQRSGSDQAGVVSYARDPQVEIPISKTPAFTEFQSRPNPHFTDLAAALRLAGSLLPADTRRHIVLIGDGRANLGDAVAEARLLHAEGVRVDTVALPVPAGPEVFIDTIDAPATLHAGERADVQAHLVSNVATAGTARWYLDRTLVASQAVTLPAGDTTISQAFAPTEPGFHAVRLVIEPERDTYAENNLGEALIQVLGAPRILVVEGAPGRAAGLNAALASIGMTAVTVAPSGLPRTAADLAAYQAVALVNVPAAALGPDAMALLQTSVRDLGMGMVVIGGDESYGPGGYAGTPLEASLPVQIQLPQDMQKPPVAVVLALESTEGVQGDQILRGAAEAVVDQLTPRDLVGVTGGNGLGPVVPLGPLTDKAAVKRQIEAMALGDPGSYQPDLSSAAQALAAAHASVKHIILLGDGDAFDNYQAIIPGIHDRGITVSAVAIGADPGGAAVMQQIASLGKGRFYQSNSLEDIPQLFLKETREALKPWIVEGTIAPRLASLADLLPGVPVDRFPTLTGYVATTPRAAADVVLKSPQGDPLLASWQYGLGRVIAWTSDAEGRWTADLLRWPSSNRFFGDLVQAALPAPGDPALVVETVIRGDRTHVLVTAPPLNGATVSVSAVAPDLGQRSVTLSATGSGRFEGDILTDQVGSYLLHVTESVGGALAHATTNGLVVPYSPEYRDLGTDLASLRAIASAGGGAMVTDLSHVFQLPVPPVESRQPVAELLLAIAILLLPVDVAVRRLIFRVEDLPAWRAAVRRSPAARATAAAAAAPTEATLARLRERVAGVRAQQQPVKRPPSSPAPPPAPEDPTGDLLTRRRRGR